MDDLMYKMLEFVSDPIVFDSCEKSKKFFDWTRGGVLTRQLEIVSTFKLLVTKVVVLNTRFTHSYKARA